MARRRSAGGALAALLLPWLAACSEDDAPPSSTVVPVATATAPSASDWKTVDPKTRGFDPAALDGIAAVAEDQGSTCFLVARDGEIVAEHYWDGTVETTPRQVFSVTKSVTSTLVGIAQADGDVSIDDRAARFIPEWRGTPSQAVTVRNLLSNDSGRSWSMESDYQRLLSAEDRTGYAVGLGQAHPPGEVWAYNNAAIQTLERVITSATGEDTGDFARQRLFEPLGMDDTTMTLDSSGTSANTFFGVTSTCRDLARFGQLFAQGGEYDGQRLVRAAWVREATGGPSQGLNPGYGLLWWVNHRGPRPGPFEPGDPTTPAPGAQQLLPGQPEELFAALGFGGQVVLVDPTSQTVVVRLGTPSASAAYSVSDAARVLTEALTAAR